MTGQPTGPIAPHSIAEYVRDYEEGRGLRGFRSGCGLVTATWGLVCPKCGVADLEEVALAGRGRIVAFSIQHVPGEELVNEAPYAYVVVELEEGGRITGWMPSVKEENSLRIGAWVRWSASYKPGVQFVLDTKNPEEK